MSTLTNTTMHYCYVFSALLFSFNCNSFCKSILEQECIPVGCVPSATVAVCFREPGLHNPPEQAPPLPPAARHAGIPPARIAHHPVDRMTDTCKNITFVTSLRTVMMVRFVHYCSQYYYTENGAFLKPSRHKPTCYIYNQIRACRNRNKANAI